MASLWISEQYAIPDDSSSSNQSAAEPTTPANFQSEPTEDPVRVSTDSGFVDDDSMLSTTTIDSETKADEQENGRTYHGYKSEKKFVLPNDERERERLNIHYHSFRLAIGDQLFYAPINIPTEILDVGTGTGIWAVDVADQNPAARVLGIDLSPIQPEWVPPNLSFQREDLDDEWHYPGRKFDLVHTREMNGIAIKDWPQFFVQAFESMKPGGWVECQECEKDIKSDDNTIPQKSWVMKWLRLREEGFQRGGMTGRFHPETVANQMRSAGFINMEILRFKMPIGPWPEDLRMRESGSLTLRGLLDHVQGLSVRVFTHYLGWTTEALEVLLMEVRKEWKREDVHSYFPVYVVYGQKPLSEVEETPQIPGVPINA